MAVVASKQLYFHAKLSWGTGLEGGSACPRGQIVKHPNQIIQDVMKVRGDFRLPELDQVVSL